MRQALVRKQRITNRTSAPTVVAMVTTRELLPSSPESRAIVVSVGAVSLWVGGGTLGLSGRRTSVSIAGTASTVIVAATSAGRRVVNRSVACSDVGICEASLAAISDASEAFRAATSKMMSSEAWTTVTLTDDTLISKASARLAAITARVVALMTSGSSPAIRKLTRVECRSPSSMTGAGGSGGSSGGR